MSRNQPVSRTGTVRCHDALTDLLALDLFAAAHRAAPGVRLRFLAEPASGADGLRTAETDLEVGSNAPPAPDAPTRRLGASPLVIVAAATSRMLTELSAADYASCTHVSVSRRGRLVDPIDALLAARGLSRHVLATVPTSRTALELVAGGGLVSTVPRLVQQAFGEHLQLESRPLPSLPSPSRSRCDGTADTMPTPRIAGSGTWSTTRWRGGSQSSRTHEHSPARLRARARAGRPGARQLRPATVEPVSPPPARSRALVISEPWSALSAGSRPC